MNVYSIATEAKKRRTFNVARQHQSFTSVEALDQSVAAFLVTYGALLTPGTLTVLDHLRRYSCKFPGASFCKIRFIAEQTQLSESTVHRALKVLEDLGMIVRKSSEINGRQGANVIVIQPFHSPTDTTNESSDDTHEKPPETNQDVPSKDVKGSRNGFMQLNLKDDIDLVKVNAKLNDPKFTASALFKHVLEGINLPLELDKKVYYRMVQDLNWTDFMFDSRNDLNRAISLSCSRFIDYYRAGHRISSLGAYFVAIFKDQIQRQRIARMAS